MVLIISCYLFEIFLNPFFLFEIILKVVEFNIKRKFSISFSVYDII